MLSSSGEFPGPSRGRAFVPKGSVGRNFHRQANKRRLREERADTQQTLCHTETCFRRFLPIFRFPTCCFCSKDLILQKCCHMTGNAANSRRRLLPERQTLLSIWVSQPKSPPEIWSRRPFAKITLKGTWGPRFVTAVCPCLRWAYLA